MLCSSSLFDLTAALRPARRASAFASIVALSPVAVRRRRIVNGLRCNSTTATSNSYLPQSSDIMVVPFKHSPEEAKQSMLNFAYGSERSLSGVVAGVRAILHYHVPKLVESSYEVFEDPIALWLPGWSVDAKMSGATRWKSDEDAANDDATFNVEGSLTFGYFPGTSFYPLSYLSMSHRLRHLSSSDLEPYSPTLHATHRVNKNREPVPVRAMPFDSSPLVLPAMLKEQHARSPISDEMLALQKDGVKWEHLTASPLYFPIYVAVLKDKRNGETMTMAMEASNPDLNSCYVYVPPRNLPEIIYPRKPLETAPAIMPRPLIDCPPFHVAQPALGIPFIENEGDLVTRLIAIGPARGPSAMTGISSDQKKRVMVQGMLLLGYYLSHRFEAWLDGEGVREKVKERSLERRGESKEERIGEIRVWEEEDDEDDDEDEEE